MSASPASPLAFLDDHERWRRIHDGLWTYHVDMRLLGVPVGRRMVAVRYTGGHWALLSPVPLDQHSRAALEARGTVRAVIVPTAFHNTFVPETMRAYPDAVGYLTIGAKRERLPADRCRELSRDLPGEWNDTLDTLALEGMPKVNEMVFLHRPSRTLLVSDLCFNIDRRYPLRTRLIMRLAGSAPGLRLSRILRLMIRDRPAFLRSFDSLLEREFDRVVMSHGAIMDSGGREALASLRHGLQPP